MGTYIRYSVSLCLMYEQVFMFSHSKPRFELLFFFFFPFRSQRGDGFPLANMLALVSEDSKELAPVLAAHIYTVCPTAVPTLPHPAPNASEDEVMESLGMLKLKDGEYETFERFLARTEVSDDSM